MAYKRLPDNLPAILREAGLKVEEVNGWRTRGRPSSTGGFDAVGVLCHHTATGPGVSDRATVRLLVKGRPDLPGPLSQLGLARDGTVFIIAAGRANHAGRAKTSGTVAGGDGNALYIGIEAFNDGRGEPWPQVQYDAYVLLAAALCKYTGNSASTVRGHKETSVTGKIDPRFDMNRFRARVGSIQPKEDEVSWSEELTKWYPGDKNSRDQMHAGQQLNQARGYAQEAYASSRRTEAIVRALAKSLGKDVETAVENALKDAVVDVEVNIERGQE